MGFVIGEEVNSYLTIFGYCAFESLSVEHPFESLTELYCIIDSQNFG
jgi:hypothetical protein